MEKKLPPVQVGRYHLNTDFRIKHYIDMELQDVERHYHEFYECIFFYAGDITYSVENRTYYPAAGDVLLINIAQFHKPIMRSATPPYDRISLFLDKNFVTKLSGEGIDFVSLFESKAGCLLHLEDDDSWTAKALLAKLTPLAVNRQEYGSELLIRCYITELLVCLGKTMVQHPPIGSAKGVSPRISTIKSYVEKNLTKDLSLDGIAAQFHLSKYHLSHEFKSHTGMSLYAYIIKLRLAKACEMLRSGYHPGDVFLDCGFNDISVFNRAFKKEFGMTPKKYVATLYKMNDME